MNIDRLSYLLPLHINKTSRTTFIKINNLKGDSMKTLLRFSFVVLFVFTANVYAQITNLLVNGSDTHFTMESGAMIEWSFDLPVGDRADLEIWIDANSNQIIDGPDFLWQAFYQIDGQGGFDGPPDMDGLVNGHISFGMPVGLAPSEYIMLFKNNGNTLAITGTVTPLSSPVFTIAGTITPPSGQTAQYLVVSIENSSDDQGKFWGAITDAGGNYSIKMDGDTTGNPWRIRIDNASKFNPAIQTPDRIYLTLDAGDKTLYEGNSFTFLDAAAEINGTVTDGDNNPIAGMDVYIWGNNGMVNRNTRSNLDGSFKIGLLSNELPIYNLWIGAGNSEDGSYIAAGRSIALVNSGNVITKNLKVYMVNSTISGRILLNGNPPNMNVEVNASVTDTAFIRTYTDYAGYYTLNVTDKLWNYNIFSGNLPPEYQLYSLDAHPGQTNVNFNFTTFTDVEPAINGIPDEYYLSQNYPNPFNPSTSINYSIPKDGFVSLKVYNVLGSEVATLVNNYKAAGNYEVSLNADNLTSGIYYYRIESGSFVQTRKMIVLK